MPTDADRHSQLLQHLRVRALYGVLHFEQKCLRTNQGICSMTTVVRCPRTGHARTSCDANAVPDRSVQSMRRCRFRPDSRSAATALEGISRCCEAFSDSE